MSGLIRKEQIRSAARMYAPALEPVEYDCIWTAATTNPNIGNGTLTAKYITRGRLCLVVINMITGSTTSYGSGSWYFSLPFTASALICMGIGLATDANTAARYPLLLACPASSRSQVFFVATTAGTTATALTSAVPFTWASDDRLYAQIEYEME